MRQVLQQIQAKYGWQIQQSRTVHGGDINDAFFIQIEAGQFFLKVNEAHRYPGMFTAEADGLKALNQHFPLKTPTVLTSGETADKQFLLMEWLHPAPYYTSDSWADFGRALAQMHRTTYDNFGWHQENYLGSIRMPNHWQSDWSAFYAENRVIPLVKRLREQNMFSPKDVQVAETFCKTLPNRTPAEPPALLHGDLWNGNATAVTVGDKTTVAIYDPAVYYGHREIDIALTKLFGGFQSHFYRTYNEVYPLQSGWQERLPVFQLSHLLLHAALFGGNYVGRCREIMK